MRKLHFLVCLGLFVSSGLAQDLSPAKINEKNSSAIVLIKTDAGAGTGFFISADGLVATAFHVVADAKKVGIKTATGDIFDHVMLLARDERKDVAILKIAGADLPFVEFDNSNEVNTGQPVVVIGNPLGMEKLQASVTDGIVSGIRDLDLGYKVIQISAPVSQGNSGGPVFSGHGKVIGIAAFKLLGGENLNFAVPSNYLRGLMDIADKAHPVQVWDSSRAQSVFSDTAPNSGNVTGLWKDSCSGNLFEMQDTRSAVRALAPRNPEFAYDLKWKGAVIFGTDPYGTWSLFKVLDPDHLLLWRWGANKKKDVADERFTFLMAVSEKKKQDCTWVKVWDTMHY